MLYRIEAYEAEVDKPTVPGGRPERGVVPGSEEEWYDTDGGRAIYTRREPAEVVAEIYTSYDFERIVIDRLG